MATGGQGVLEIKDDQLSEVESITMLGRCYCIRSYDESTLAVVVHTNSKIVVQLLNTIDLVHGKVLIELERFQAPLSLPTCGHLSISKNFIALVDPYSKLLKIYDKNGKPIKEIDVSGTVRGVLITPDERYVLISDSCPGCVTKFKLFGDSSPEWICEDLREPKGLCTGRCGEIYAASPAENCIYQICGETGRTIC